jgi:hypothetical protein
LYGRDNRSHYPKRGNGRPPIGLERMLRIHFIQHWFSIWRTLPARKHCTTAPPSRRWSFLLASLTRQPDISDVAKSKVGQRIK